VLVTDAPRGPRTADLARRLGDSVGRAVHVVTLRPGRPSWPARRDRQAGADQAVMAARASRTGQHRAEQ